MTRLQRFALCLLAGAAMACDENSTRATISGPGGQAANLTGTFSSTSLTDSNGFTAMRWILTQTGDQIAGTMTISGNTQAANGTIAGTLSGTTLTFTGTIPPNGFTPVIAGCTATFSGTAQNVTRNRISATYTGSSTCLNAPINGTVVLERETTSAKAG